MAYTLACHTTLFAAIGPDSATELGGCPDPARLSVIAIHGTADRNIPYDGGRGDGIAHIDGPAIPALAASWRRTDHCASPVIKTAGAVTTSAARCPAGRAVELDHHRRSGASVARGRARPARPEAAAHRPAVHGPERDAGHLAVLRGPPSPLSPAARAPTVPHLRARAPVVPQPAPRSPALRAPAPPPRCRAQPRGPHRPSPGPAAVPGPRRPAARAPLPHPPRAPTSFPERLYRYSLYR